MDIAKALRENAPADHGLASGDLMREAAAEIERLRAAASNLLEHFRGGKFMVDDRSLDEAVYALEAALASAGHEQGDYPGLDRSGKSLLRRVRQAGLFITLWSGLQYPLAALEPIAAQTKIQSMGIPEYVSVFSPAKNIDHGPAVLQGGQDRRIVGGNLQLSVWVDHYAGPNNQFGNLHVFSEGQIERLSSLQSSHSTLSNHIIGRSLTGIFEVDRRPKSSSIEDYCCRIDRNIGSQLPLGGVLGATYQLSRGAPQQSCCHENAKSENDQQSVGDLQPISKERRPELASLLVALLGVAFAFYCCGKIGDCRSGWYRVGLALIVLLLFGNATFGLLLGLDFWSLGRGLL